MSTFTLADIEFSEAYKIVGKALNDLYQSKKLAHNPLLSCLLLTRFMEQNPNRFGDAGDALAFLLRQIIYTDVMPRSAAEDISEWRAAIALVATYFPIDGYRKPRRKYELANDLLMDQTFFRQVVNRECWESLRGKPGLGNVAAELDGIPESTFRRALGDGIEKLTQALIEREKTLVLPEMPRVPVPEEPTISIPLEQQDWFHAIRDGQIAQLEHLLRADQSTCVWDDVYIPRKLKRPDTGEVAEEKVLQALERIVLIGQAGCGKTTALRHCASAEMESKPDSLVLWVSLADYANHALGMGLRDFVLEKQIIPLCSDSTSIREIDDQLRFMDINDRLIYYLDDWDSVPNELMTKVAYQISALKKYRLAGRSDKFSILGDAVTWNMIELSDAELLGLVDKYSAVSGNSERTKIMVLSLLNRETEFRQAAYTMPLLIDVASRKAEIGKCSMSIVMGDIVSRLFDRAVVGDYSSELTLDVLSTTAMKASVGNASEINLSRPAFQYSSNGALIPDHKVTLVLEHAVRGGILVPVANHAHRFLNDAFLFYFRAAGLASNPYLEQYIRGKSDFTFDARLLRQVAVLRSLEGRSQEFVDAVSKSYPQTLVGRILAAECMCELALAGCLEKDHGDEFLRSFIQLVDQDAGIALHLLLAKFLFARGEKSAAARCISRVVGLLSEPNSISPSTIGAHFAHTPDIYEALLLQIREERPVGSQVCGQIILGLLNLVMVSDFESIAYRIRYGSELVSKTVARALTQSKNWYIRTILSEDPETRVHLEQVEATAVPGDQQKKSQVDTSLVKALLAKISRDNHQEQLEALQELYNLSCQFSFSDLVKSRSDRKALSEALTGWINQSIDVEICALATLNMGRIFGTDVSDQLIEIARDHPALLARLVAMDFFYRKNYANWLVKELDPPFPSPLWAVTIGFDSSLFLQSPRFAV